MKNALKKLIIHTDGGARGNPGPAAIGVVFQNEKGETLKKYGEAIGIKTNNEAEYEAVIFALKKAKALFGGEAAGKMFVEVRTDSELMARQLGDEYKIEEERIGKLYLAIRNLKIDFGAVAFKYIPREKNAEADRLVNRALNDAESQSALAL